jgi:hypothetical protein
MAHLLCSYVIIVKLALHRCELLDNWWCPLIKNKNQKGGKGGPITKNSEHRSQL